MEFKSSAGLCHCVQYDSTLFFVLPSFTSFVIEQVSSFSTCGRKYVRNSNFGFRKPHGCNEDDFIRWRNCLQRDFTING